MLLSFPPLLLWVTLSSPYSHDFFSTQDSHVSLFPSTPLPLDLICDSDFSLSPRFFYLRSLRSLFPPLKVPTPSFPTPIFPTSSSPLQVPPLQVPPLPLTNFRRYLLVMFPSPIYFTLILHVLLSNITSTEVLQSVKIGIKQLSIFRHFRHNPSELQIYAIFSNL